MGPDPYRDELREMTRALLAGLEHSKDGTGGDETALLQSILECVGDLRRLEEPLPPWCAQWLSQVAEDRMRAALTRYQRELEALPEPIGPVGLHEDGPSDEGIEFALTRRDQIASALLAITDWSLRRGRAPVSLAEWSGVHASARKWDDALAKVVDRPTAENLLSVRIAIADDDGWLGRLGEGDEPSAENDEAPAPSDFGELGAPDDGVLDQYFNRGAMHRYVEGYAASSAEFAETLAATIETLRELGELGDAVVPRIWLKRYRASQEPIAYGRPRLQLAAADGKTSEAVHRIELGELPGLSSSVYATIELSSETATLRVYDGDALEGVSFGGVEASHSDDGGEWTAQCPIGTGVLRVKLEGRDGRIFEEELELHEAP